MKRLLQARGTTAAIVGILVVLVVGSGYALANTGGAIRACSQKHTHVLYMGKCKKGDKKLSWNKTGPQGPRGPQGSQGPQGTAGATGAAGAPGPAAQWALVSGDHTTILAQSGGISIASTSGAGVYLNMGQDVSGEVIEATAAYTDADNGFKGPVQATICGGAPYGGTCSIAGTNDTHHVWVFTENPGGTVGENHAFYVAVFK